MIIIVMGVSGSGKTTVGSLLAKEFGWPFYDGDDFHPRANVEKMSGGLPLTDADREGWLAALRAKIDELRREGRSAVIACSALKQSYREMLAHAGEDARFVYLKGDFETIRRRIEERKDHFMKVGLLASQFETLEEPKDAVVVNCEDDPERNVRLIRQALGL